MSKRFSLREFQQNVLDRLKVQATAGDRISTLGVQIGEKNWLVDMTEISEVLEVPNLTAVPLTKSWYRGVANVRGKIYSITDMAAFMNLGETVQDAQSRVLLVGQKYSFNAGLLVTRVLGLRNAKEWRHSVQDGEESYEDDNGQVWTRLNIKQLLQQTDFLQIGA